MQLWPNSTCASTASWNAAASFQRSFASAGSVLWRGGGWVAARRRKGWWWGGSGVPGARGRRGLSTQVEPPRPDWGCRSRARSGAAAAGCGAWPGCVAAHITRAAGDPATGQWRRRSFSVVAAPLSWPEWLHHKRRCRRSGRLRRHAPRLIILKARLPLHGAGAGGVVLMVWWRCGVAVHGVAGGGPSDIGGAHP